MNVRLAPPFFVADQAFAWFVEGFTSDDPKEWRLMVAPRDFHGCINMNLISSVADFDQWLMTDMRPLSGHELKTMTLLIGNMQRMLKGLPKLNSFTS